MVPILADYGLGDALLTVLAIFFLIVWFWILITILADLFRDHELSGWLKAVWVIFLIFIPFLTALLYLIVRGNGMRDRTIAEQKELQKMTDSYIRDVSGSSSAADELAKLADLREKGSISAEEYEALKAKIIA